MIAVEKTQPSLDSRVSFSQGNIFNNTAIGMGTEIIAYILSFLSSILVARALGPASRGSFAIVCLITSYLVMFFTFGTTAAAQIQLAKKEHTIAGIHTFALAYSIFVCMASLILFLLAKTWLLASFLKNIDPRFCFIAVVLVPFALYSTLANQIMLGINHIPMMSTFKLIKTFTDLFGVLVFLWMLTLGLSGAVIAWGGSLIVSVFLQCFWLLKLSGWQIKFNRDVVRKTITFGGKIHLAFLPAAAILMMDSFLLNHFRGTREVGLYAVAYSLMYKIAILFTALQNAAQARIIGEKLDTAIPLVRRLIRQSVFVAVFFALCLSVFGQPFIRLIYGEAYERSGIVLAFLSVGMVSLTVTNFLHLFVVGQLKKPSVSAAINWSVFLLGLVLFFLLIPRYGLVGTALASSLIFFAQMVGYLCLIRWTSPSILRETLLIQKSDFAIFYDRLSTWRVDLMEKFASDER